MFRTSTFSMCRINILRFFSQLDENAQHGLRRNLERDSCGQEITIKLVHVLWKMHLWLTWYDPPPSLCLLSTSFHHESEPGIHNWCLGILCLINYHYLDDTSVHCSLNMAALLNGLCQMRNTCIYLQRQSDSDSLTTSFQC